MLDIAFNEDNARIRKDHAPENLALIQHIALNLLRQDASAKVGIKVKALKLDGTIMITWHISSQLEYAFALRFQQIYLHFSDQEC
jgi:hypothetical protein